MISNRQSMISIFYSTAWYDYFSREPLVSLFKLGETIYTKQNKFKNRMRVPKFVVYSCRLIRIVFVFVDSLMFSCMKRHRRKITFLIHPFSFAALLLVVALFLYYEMLSILPDLYDTSGLFYKVHWVLALFVTYNVVGNMIYCHVTDSSFLSLPRDSQDPIVTEAHLWHLCTHCQMLVPPRAWHCRLCNACVLKRDHHCNVTASCIGHRNQRFFIALLFHLTLGTLASLVYNVIHMVVVRVPMLRDPFFIMAAALEDFDAGEFMSTMTADTTKLIINGVALKLSLFCFALAGSQFVYHCFLIARGTSTFQMWDCSYDLGFWSNVRCVLGERMFWTLLSPMIDSPLPHDGTRWQLAPLKERPKKPVRKAEMCAAWDVISPCSYLVTAQTHTHTYWDKYCYAYTFLALGKNRV